MRLIMENRSACAVELENLDRREEDILRILGFVRDAKRVPLFVQTNDR
jgi:hypothetical protein